MKKQGLRYAGFVLSLVVLALIIYSLANYKTLEAELFKTVGLYGLVGLFIVSLFLELVPQFVSPHLVLLTVTLLGIDIKSAVVVAIVGSLIASLVGFYLGNKYGAEYAYSFVSVKDAEKFEKAVNKYGKVVVFLAALSPLPYIPVVIGASKFTWKNFLAYGVIPRLFSFIVVGYTVSLALA